MRHHLNKNGATLVITSGVALMLFFSIGAPRIPSARKKAKPPTLGHWFDNGSAVLRWDGLKTPENSQVVLERSENSNDEWSEVARVNAGGLSDFQGTRPHPSSNTYVDAFLPLDEGVVSYRISVYHNGGLLEQSNITEVSLDESIEAAQAQDELLQSATNLPSLFKSFQKKPLKEQRKTLRQALKILRNASIRDYLKGFSVADSKRKNALTAGAHLVKQLKNKQPLDRKQLKRFARFTKVALAPLAEIETVEKTFTPQVTAQEQSLEVESNHPRLLLGSEGLAKIKRLRDDGKANRVFLSLLTKAESLTERVGDSYVIGDIYDTIQKEYSEAEKDGRFLDPRARKLKEARELLDRVAALSVAYAIQPDTHAGNRAWRRLRFEIRSDEAFENSSDWKYPDYWGLHVGREGNRSAQTIDTLQTAEHAAAVALAYDWFYDKWNEGEKRKIKRALFNNAIRTSLFSHGKFIYPGSAEREKAWWAGPDETGYMRPTNWNLVSNGGFIMAALAVSDDMFTSNQNRFAKIALNECINSLKHGVDAFYGRDGGIVEGLGYYRYATDYLAFGVESLISATGQHHGFLNKDNIGKSAHYQMTMMSANRNAFGHGDNGTKDGPAPALQWIGNRFNSPAASYWSQPAELNWEGKPQQYNHLRSSLMYLLFYNDGGTQQDYESQKTMSVFRDKKIVTMRENWTEDNSYFVGFKGGNNQDPHTNLDLGSFVYEGKGIMWFQELGMGNYALPGYFSRDNYYSPAYNYLRIRTEGQNAFVLDPAEHPGQYIKAKASLLHLNDQQKHGVVDLREAYEGVGGNNGLKHNHNADIYRGFAVLGDGKAFMVKDHLSKLPKDMKYRWIGYTPALSARFLKSNDKSAIVLYHKENFQGRKLLVYVKEKATHGNHRRRLWFEYQTVDGHETPLLEPTYLEDHWPNMYDETEARQKPVNGLSKIVIHSYSFDWLNATVVMVPFEENEEVAIPDWVAEDPRYDTVPEHWRGN